MWISFFLWLSSALMPFAVFYLVAFGILARRPVFSDFLEGAREGMKITAELLPTLIGLMASVSVLRASGFLDFLSELLAAPAGLLKIPAQVVPVATLRLVSNSAAVSLMLDIFREQGPDSAAGMTASLLLGCTETVFYCLSIYFGRVGIRKTRFTLPGALLATAAGIGASIWLGGRLGA